MDETRGNLEANNLSQSITIRESCFLNMDPRATIKSIKAKVDDLEADVSRWTILVGLGHRNEDDETLKAAKALLSFWKEVQLEISFQEESDSRG